MTGDEIDEARRLADHRALLDGAGRRDQERDAKSALVQQKAVVGLSVIVPYIGAVVVTFPVVLIAWFQWGWSPEFFWLNFAYLVIQGLDGNVLVPLLFSAVVNLHPVAIIVAILVFGGFWGF